MEKQIYRWAKLAICHIRSRRIPGFLDTANRSYTRRYVCSSTICRPSDALSVGGWPQKFGRSSCQAVPFLHRGPHSSGMRAQSPKSTRGGRRKGGAVAHVLIGRESGGIENPICQITPNHKSSPLTSQNRPCRSHPQKITPNIKSLGETTWRNARRGYLKGGQRRKIQKYL